ncbi:DUF1871 family protein [Peribacillus sp. NPDC097295]|uniref:DUF1871 family protein n=1 Tax=Peribacillus sp. NPDC097295 TaxID=3364402 RepID=UPI003805D915
MIIIDTQQMNIAFVTTLQEWDPFGIGGELYEPEIADTVVAIRDIDDLQELAEKIKSIYEYAFDEPVQLKRCLQVAQKLLIIKNDASCSL